LRVYVVLFINIMIASCKDKVKYFCFTLLCGFN
jgi:hypothetical protein